MKCPRSRLLAAGAVTGALLASAPGIALADGPGYGGTADALTVQWDAESGTADGLAVYAVGFRGGSPVQLRVGSGEDRTIAADQSGALRVLVLGSAAPTPITDEETAVLRNSDAFSAGTSVLALGQTPAGDVRRLVGSVPPAAAGHGVQDVAPWGIAVAAVAGAVVWLRRRGELFDKPGKRRWAAQHRG
ncbi:hypothetical protein [Actinoplanes sp. TFC3]|uniref:hypothetical protein n=1 Tax=Actinoplanes sp. TFC3 TaxID=1710355 RepID=UPI000B2CDE3D|nr:hypothetical protein [Actinoplanes sp. TFC3]